MLAFRLLLQACLPVPLLSLLQLACLPVPLFLVPLWLVEVAQEALARYR